jgi:hypothetical protein
MQIRKSDDLRNACAKSSVLQVFLAQAFAMQIISTPEFSCEGAGLELCAGVACCAPSSAATIR